MSEAPIIWFDQLAGTRASEVPPQILEHFSVRTTSRLEEVDHLLREARPAALFFDFDYPDRRRLDAFARLKAGFPSVPVVMVTLQHSESLAVWAFRQGALDYLVKPVPEAELASCIERLQKIEKSRRDRSSRRSVSFSKPPIPAAIPNTPKSRKQQLAPAIFFVQQNYSQRVSSDAMARLCGMSPSHFSRLFKEVYDLTFQEFLLRYRVFQACQFLNASAANISDVAYSVGFSDPSYFTRVFKRYVGVAPSDFAAANDDIWRRATESEPGFDGDTSTSQVVRTLSSRFSA